MTVPNKRELANLVCDQCSASHHACDRRKPVCKRCQTLDISCTYVRKLVRFPRKDYCNLETIKILPKTKTLNQSKLKKSSDSSQKEKLRKNNSKSLTQIAAVKNSESGIKYSEIMVSEPLTYNFLMPDWQAVIKKFSGDAGDRYYLSLLINLTGFSIYRCSSYCRKFLSKLFLKKIQLPSKKGICSPLVYNAESQNLLDLATEAYFYYSNPFTAPLTRVSFSRRPCTLLLQLAIWRAGLNFIDFFPLRDYLIEKLDAQLGFLTVPSKLNFNLQTIQALLIIVNNVTMQPLSKSCSGFLNMASVIGISLGLHQPSPSAINIEAALERQLTLNQLTFTGYNFSVNTRFFWYPLNDGFANLYASYKMIPKARYLSPYELYEEFRFKLISRFFQIPSLVKAPKEQLCQLICDTKDYACELGTFVLSCFVAVHINLLSNLDFRLEQFKKQQFAEKFAVTLKKTIHTSEKIFRETFLYLHRLKIKVHVEDDFNNSMSYSFNDHASSPLYDYQLLNCPQENLQLCQYQSLISIMYHYFLIQFINYSRNISHQHPIKFESYKYIQSKEFLIQGVKSSISLINSLNLISTGPFKFSRIYILLAACRFILQNHQNVCKMVTPEMLSHDPSLDITTTLNNSLKIARGIIINNAVSSQSQYSYQSFLTLLDALLDKYDVILS